MTRAENYVTLEFLSRSSNEGFARVAAAGFAAQLTPHWMSWGTPRLPSARR